MKNEELKNIFLAEAQENQEELNKLFTQLERNPQNREAIDAIFRITHTLKANAAAMGFTGISEMAHLLEDIFSEIKKGQATLTEGIFNDLYRAMDKLGEMIQGIKTDEKVAYKGLKAKLRVILRKFQEGEPDKPTTVAQAQKENKAAENQAQEVATPQDAPPEEPQTPAVSPAVEKPKAQEEEKESDDDSAAPKITFSEVIQVPIRKLDALMNLVGELAIEKDRIANLSEREHVRTADFARLYRITSDLQYSVMGVRLVQVSLLFNKFHRIVRDVSVAEGKKVKLDLKGTNIEIDRNVLQTISDSLIHLVRNAVSHGIERPEVRQAAGKNAEGTLLLSARSEKEYVIIDIKDDGGGINPEVILKKIREKKLIEEEKIKSLTPQEIIQLIFLPGFSSAEKVTDISGRGVGMDVVKKAIDSIGGKIEVTSQVGQGTTISLFLPSSMAVKNVLLFVMGPDEYAVPLSYTQTVVAVPARQLHRVGGGLMLAHGEENIPVLFLKDILKAQSLGQLHLKNLLQTYEAQAPENTLHAIIVSVFGKSFALVVDALLHQKEIIEKPLGKPLDAAPFISGATILGNGKVCLVVDVPSLAQFFFEPTRPHTLK